MSKIIFTLLLLIVGNILCAQYVHYTDTRDLNAKTQAQPFTKVLPDPASAARQDTITDTVRVILRDTAKITIRDTLRVTMKDTAKVTMRDTLKVTIRDTIRVLVRDTIKITDTIRVTDTVRVLVRDTINLAIVYHKWPDHCPGVEGKVPVLTNYVPAEIVPKLTEIFKGFLYSITRIKDADNKTYYKLKVCENGEIKIKYADENGDLLKQGGP